MPSVRVNTTEEIEKIFQTATFSNFPQNDCAWYARGNDAHGTHCYRSDDLIWHAVTVLAIVSSIVGCLYAYQKISEIFRRQRRSRIVPAAVRMQQIALTRSSTSSLPSYNTASLPSYNTASLPSYAEAMKLAESLNQSR